MINFFKNVNAVLGLFFLLYLPVIGFSEIRVADASPLNAEKRGAQILEMQLERARHLKELEYQAEVLERQARIAKVQEQIDRTIGFEFTSVTPNQISKSHESPQEDSLPQVISLEKNAVTFRFSSGFQAEYQVGDKLPSGHKLVAISMVSGALVEKNGVLTRLQYKR